MPKDAALEQKIMYAVVLRTIQEYKMMDQQEDGILPLED